jgi:hypothetical protein
MAIKNIHFYKIINKLEKDSLISHNLSDIEKIIYCIKVFRFCLDECSSNDRKKLRELKKTQKKIECYATKYKTFLTNDQVGDIFLEYTIT